MNMKTNRQAAHAAIQSDEPRTIDGGDIRKVPLRDLRLDSNYQRDLEASKVRKMVDDWDPRRAQVVILSHRAGILWIVDGQHRVAALRERGELYVLAQVLEGLSQSEEADLFVALQRGRKNLNAWDLFKAETAAGHEDVLNLVRIVNSHGFQIDRTAGHGHIGAVGALRRIYSLGGEPLLSLCLNTVRQVWVGDKKALDGHAIEGLALFMHSFRGEPQFDSGRAFHILEGTPAITFLRLAQEIAQNRSSASSSATNVAEAIRNKYNERLAPAKKLGAIQARGRRIR